MSGHLVFLKLGGSLITVKEQPHTPRLEVIERLAQEVADACAQDHGLQVLLGHGSGSYGHVVASRFNTRMGVKTVEEWAGFAEVWRQAVELNRLVMRALEGVRLPVIAFPPSARVIARDGRVSNWDIDPLHAALDQGQYPVVYGDTVFDLARGGTILSTEDLFIYLARQLKPSRMLFAGLEPGVWADYPARSQIVQAITPTSFPQVLAGLKGSVATDVTGGMLDKVQQVLALVKVLPGLQGLIFSGETPGNVRRTLLGEDLGTVIRTAPGGG